MRRLSLLQPEDVNVSQLDAVKLQPEDMNVSQLDAVKQQPACLGLTGK